MYKGFSKKLTHAIVGIGAGPKKIAQCEESAVKVIDEDGLFAMIESSNDNNNNRFKIL